MLRAIVGTAVSRTLLCGATAPGRIWQAASARRVCARSGRSWRLALARLVHLASTSMRAVSACPVGVEHTQRSLAAYLVSSARQEDLLSQPDKRLARFALLVAQVSEVGRLVLCALEEQTLANQACQSARNARQGHTARRREPSIANLVHQARSACGEATIAASAQWANTKQVLGCLCAPIVPWGRPASLEAPCYLPRLRDGGDCVTRLLPTISGFPAQVRSCAQRRRDVEVAIPVCFAKYACPDTSRITV